MKNKEQSMEPMLKSRTHFAMDPLIFGNKETRKNSKSQVHTKSIIAERNQINIGQGHQDREGIQRVTNSLPAAKTTLKMNLFIYHHQDSLQKKGRQPDLHPITSIMVPKTVSPGPKVSPMTLVPAGAFPSRIAFHTCGRVAEDILPRCFRTC
jgi:hypothetical protein